MKTGLILIGGSAGSFRTVCAILRVFPGNAPFPLVLVLHRLKNVNSGFCEALTAAAPGKIVTEPSDKDPVENGRIYLAPANYHLCFEDARTFSLNTDKPVQYSRPSIDMTFYSAAEIFGSRATAFILSGANKDGAAGAAAICTGGGRVIAQDPAECEVETMSQETIRRTGCAVYSEKEIIRFFSEPRL